MRTTEEPAPTASQVLVRVLIADDHEATRNDIRRAIVADARFSVCAEAVDAPSAVDAALREQPDICLLDVRMPGSGLAAGWEITSRLPRTKLVMLTVSEEDRDLFVALSAGVAGYLLKSIDRRRLPHALWDIHQGTFTMPRELMGRVAGRFRGSAAPRRSVAASDGAGRLTSREWQVLELLARGLSTRKVAAELCLTPGGVRVHINSIVKKLVVRDRKQAVEAFRRQVERSGSRTDASLPGADGDGSITASGDRASQSTGPRR